MATLYKRADAVQRRMLRIIEGAVKNTLDAHSELFTNLHDPMDRNKFARSVAKRAVGTLSSQLDEVLALQPSATKKADDSSGKSSADLMS